MSPIPKLHIVYDFADQPALRGPFYDILLITAFLISAYFFVRNKSYTNTLLLKFKRQGLLMAGFAVFLLLIVTAYELKIYFETKNLLDDKQYSIVEGRVQDYEPLPPGGNGVEQFRVDSLYFSLNEYNLGAVGYNKAASQGGVIRPNLYVRIYYPTYGTIGILRLETE